MIRKASLVTATVLAIGLSLLMFARSEQIPMSKYQPVAAVFRVPLTSAVPKVDAILDSAWSMSGEFLLPDSHKNGQNTSYRFLQTERRIFGFITNVDSTPIPVNRKGNTDMGDKLNLLLQNHPNTLWLQFTVDGELMTGVLDNHAGSTEPPLPTPFNKDEFSYAVKSTAKSWSIEFSFIKNALLQRGGSIQNLRFHLGRTNAIKPEEKYPCAETESRISFAGP